MSWPWPFRLRDRRYPILPPAPMIAMDVISLSPVSRRAVAQADEIVRAADLAALEYDFDSVERFRLRGGAAERRPRHGRRHHGECGQAHGAGNHAAGIAAGDDGALDLLVLAGVPRHGAERGAA